jgi:tetratricopeptide (TPR) repeat protein
MEPSSQSPPIAPPALQAVLSGQPARPLPDRVERDARRQRVWDGAWATLVVLLAFLLGSSPARNSDVWRHLATGRALVEGSYWPGAEPFAYTTDGAGWVNPAWLFDLVAYALYQAVGGAGLVVLKALLVAALAGLLLHLCWRGSPKWVAALAVALALVALGPFLTLRPTFVSYLLLGLTLWWLERPIPAGARSTVRAYLPLLVAFVLWVNLDEWFLLGPLTLALYWIGSLVQARWEIARGRSAPLNRQQARALALATAAGFLVCLLNPYHVRAFTLPWVLRPLPGPAAEALAADLLRSPFQGRLLLTPAAVAYYLLALLGLASFAGNVTKPRWSRLLVWVVFFVLSAWRTAALPFFAVVAGPMLALGFQQLAAERALRGPAPAVGRRPSALWGQLAATAVLVALAVAAWPGWLQGFPAEPRRWVMEPEPSLVSAAEQLERWRADGLLADDAHGFCLSPAGADALAWLCPGEKSFLDGRPSAFPPSVLADFLNARLTLLRQSSDVAGAQEKDWRAILHRYKVAYVILYDPSELAVELAVKQFLAEPETWSLVHLHGRTTIFARRGQPGGPPPLDLSRWAFHPSAEQKAPAQGPGRPPEPRIWLDAFSRPRPLANLGRDEALLYLTHFESQKSAAAKESLAWWKNNLAGTVLGLPGTDPSLGSLPAATLFRLALLEASPVPEVTKRKTAPRAMEQLAFQLFYSFHVRQRDQGPPGDVYLAIRAARRSLREDPDDPATHRLLGEAYLRLLRQTRERAAAPYFPLLVQVRRLQAIAALARAVRLRPDLIQAHESLTSVYQEMGAFDLALHHLEEQLRLSKAAGPRPGESADRAAKRLKSLEDESERRLGAGVRNLRTQVEAQSLDLDVMARARLAESRGLPGKALDILLAADLASLGHDGVVQELHLLLRAGRGEEVRDFLEEPEREEVLGMESYRWLHGQLAAIDGNYAQAEHDLARLARPVVTVSELKLSNKPYREIMSLVIGMHVLDRLAGIHENPRAFRARVDSLAGSAYHEADLLILRGLLALEAGEMERAEVLFREGLVYGGRDREGGPTVARHYLQLMGKELGR